MSDSIGFLLSDVSRLMRRRFDERARALGATRTQWKALAHVGRNEGLHQSALAELLEVEPITLTRMVDRLEEAGLVERRRDPADRRAWQLFLTEKSHPVLERMHDIAGDLTASALAGVSSDELAQLTTTLEQIRANLHAPAIQKDSAHG
jgi:DNA-binding MarR family transcriptional regulator